MTKFLKTILIILMLAIPGVGFILTDNHTVIKSENRHISQFPKEYSDMFFADLVNWFNDRLFFKLSVNEELYPVFNNFFKDFNFSSSQFSVNGVEGWIFSGDKSSYVYSQHSKFIPLQKGVLDKKIRELNAIRSSFKGKMYFVVGPDKHGIYPEYMDPNIQSPGKYRFFDSYKSSLNLKDITVIDNYKALKKAKDPNREVSLYFGDDTHWNRYGAYSAFKNVMNVIDPESEQILYDFKFSHHINGDLIRNIKNPKRDILDNAEVINPRNNKVTIEDIFSGKTKEITFNVNIPQPLNSRYSNSKAVSDKKVFVISDSYGISFVPYVVEHFKQVTHMNRRLHDLDSILNEIRKDDPDYLIYLNVEREIPDRVM